VTATLDTPVDPATFSWHIELGVSWPVPCPYNSLTLSGAASVGGKVALTMPVSCSTFTSTVY